MKNAIKRETCKLVCKWPSVSILCKNAIKREPCKLVCKWPSVSILCNKQTIITALLLLILPLSPWRGVRGEASGQAQTFTLSEDVGMGACIKKK